jgi:2-methylcitrate dehydratase PrpD
MNPIRTFEAWLFGVRIGRTSDWSGLVRLAPVVQALGEQLGSNGRDLIVAMAAGYEIQGRLGKVLFTELFKRHFHPQGVLGVFSAASYGRDGKPDSSALDAAVESSKDVIRGLRTSARWPMRTAGAVMRSITIGG